MRNAEYFFFRGLKEVFNILIFGVAAAGNHVAGFDHFAERSLVFYDVRVLKNMRGSRNYRGEFRKIRRPTHSVDLLSFLQ